MQQYAITLVYPAQHHATVLNALAGTCGHYNPMQPATIGTVTVLPLHGAFSHMAYPNCPVGTANIVATTVNALAGLPVGTLVAVAVPVHVGLR